MVPFLDLIGQYRALRGEIDPAILGVLESGEFVLGKAVRDFEDAFARYAATRYALACSSGTAALHMALLAAGIERGDEVITTPMTFVATASAIDYVGARPVFVDIERDSATLDPARIEAAITPRTRAIMPVHLYGQAADMRAIDEIAARRNLLVIEDAAQAHGAEHHGRRAGSMGLLSAFSFYPGKNLGAYGEGGMIVTDAEPKADTVRMLRDWGQDRKYRHRLKGFNYRMDGVQGAILGIKLRHVERWTEARRQVAAWYREALVGLDDIELPIERPGNRHVYHVFAIRTPPARRDAMADGLRARGIATGLHYPIPVHLQPCFAELGHRVGDFPIAEAHAAAQLSLPIFPEMTAAMVDEVAAALRAVWRGGHA
jgi:dTDP-4-amino-4,6-dideoxygalactose transaminase